MGVTGLWPILHPCARPTPLPTLNRKRLAVDASIWIYQFLKAVRDKEGNALRNSHVVGFFRRICKLLFFGIKPVFVFDGGAPALKRQTIQGRKQRREGRREDAIRTAGKLLAVQMQRRGEEEAERRKRERERERAGLSNDVEEEVIPEGQDLVYVGEEGMNAQQRTQSRRFKKTDQYHLPELNNGIEGMGQPNDPRIMSAEELEEYARQFHNGEDVNLYDFSKIDFNGDFFMSLPAVDRYNILNAARLRSRLRMGLSKEQLEDMFPDRMAFSRFQIERVRERNELTQRLMNLNGMNGDDGMFGVGTNRIAGERDREYVLVKNDGVEGGYALGVVTLDKKAGERDQPIDVDFVYQQPDEKEEPSESEDEFEDVPVEGLNRLPKLKATRTQNPSYADFKAQQATDQRRQPDFSRNSRGSMQIKAPVAEPDSLFVDDEQGESSSRANGHVVDEEEEDLNRAIAMSLQKDTDAEDLSEEEHLSRAIALSMKQNHGAVSDGEEDEEFEDVQMPEYEQRAVPDIKPLSKSSGSMLAHIVNNRANAAIPKRKTVEVDSDSDSDMDLQSALAKARKGKAPENQRHQPAPVVANKKNPFDGPLPFERLDLKGSIFGKKKQSEKATSHHEESGEEDLAGGFEKNGEEAPKPLPPWLIGTDDIRSQVKEQQQQDLELNAEDKEMALEEERMLQKHNGPIEIESSDDGSDVEIVDPPPPAKPTEDLGDLAEEVRGRPPVSSIPDNRHPSVDKPTSPAKSILPEEEKEEEPVDWSESDYGESTTKSAANVTSKGPTENDVASSNSKSVTPEFEDVDMEGTNATSTYQSPGKSQTRSPSPTPFDQKQASTDINPTSQISTDDFFDAQQAAEDAAFDEFSDPEDEELLAQLAIEAEEHARFASTLNNKSERENQEAYERELKALRNQQKKDRRDADEVSHIMITECQALLRLFGLPYITAPMEAEAQCAELVRLGLVDGVVTDDCDIFLFGGTRVYKNMFNSNKFVECYLSNDIEKELTLSREHLISIAHLLGSDYTEGLPGVGPVTALEIISEFSNSGSLDEFRNWWKSVQNNPQAPAISTEPSTFRKKFRRSQNTKLFLPPGFPSPAVTQAYLKPDVDSTPEPFQWGVPDLDRLREFLMATIGWSQERTDEVLVPVIRDMNRREQEGTQSNITRFFDGTVGAGVNTGDKGKARGGSKRMNEAYNKLKAKKQGSAISKGQTMGDKAAEWARKNELSYREKEAGKKRKGKKRVATVDVEDEVADEADDESASGEDEYRETVSMGKATADKGKASAKRKKVKA